MIIHKLFNKKIIGTYTIIKLLRGFALILMFFIIYLILFDWEDNKTLIGALGILISALLASFSVILSIEFQEQNVKKDKINKIKYFFFQLCYLKMNLNILLVESKVNKISYFDLQRIIKTINNINSIYEKNITNNDFTKIFSNEVLTNALFLNLKLGLLNNSFQSLNKSIDVTSAKNKKINNPLKEDILLNINESLNLITSILSSLRDNNKNLFNDSTISDCTHYHYQQQRS